MITAIKNVDKDYTNCNFCKRAEYEDSDTERIRVFPYKTVLEFGSSKSATITIAICSDCLKELVEKAKQLKFI